MHVYFANAATLDRVARGIFDRSLPKEEWTHAGHFAAAFWVLDRYSQSEAEAIVPNVIRAYNTATGVINSDGSGYHQTITLASLRAVRAFRNSRSTSEPTFAACVTELGAWAVQLAHALLELCSLVLRARPAHVVRPGFARWIRRRAALVSARKRRDEGSIMNAVASAQPTSLDAAFALRAPSEVVFSATVTSQPHFFYGSNTHAMHEAFNVRADDGHALEVVDNVKLAPRVPVTVGDRIAIQGELIPDASHGPLVHWTHHDPAGQHADGYIDFAGRRYA